MAQPTSLPLICVPEGSTLSTLTKGHRHWATANGFSGQRGRLLALPASDGSIASHLFGIMSPATRLEQFSPPLFAILPCSALAPLAPP